MKRHVKASSAGSTLGQGASHGSRIRGAFATRGASSDSKGSGAPAGRLALGLLTILALALTIGASSATAKTYSPGTPASFCTGTGTAAGECGLLKGVAVDSSNGNVYVVDQGNNRVDQFAADGTFVRAFGSAVADGTTAAAQVCTTTCFKGFSTPGIAGGFGTGATSIAVDPQTHVVYVMTAAARLAYYNGSTGAFIGQTEGAGNQAGAPNPPNINAGAPEGFANSSGVAVDSSDPSQSYLYVATQPGAGARIDKFKIGASGVTAGSYVCQITGTATDTSVNHTECGGNGVPAHKDGAFTSLEFGLGVGGSQPGGNLVVDSAGNVVALEAVNRQVVSRFAKNGNFLNQFTPTQPRPEGVATLPNGNVLVAAGGAAANAGGSRIQEYDPASPASPLSEFGLGTIGGSYGIAVSAGEVYVSDKTNKKIWKFAAAPEAPAVTTEAATALSKFRATLHGTVNPNLGNVSDCHFEYGTTIAYGSTAPCSSSPGSGGSPVAVSAALSGLSAGTTYHFRLVATNSVGTTNGNDLELTTTLLNKPEVITTPGATAIAQTTAKVAGKVNPNEVAVTDCHFNYGTTEAYGSVAPCDPAPGSGFGLVDVSASLTGLNPNTTYHFQLEATNGDGRIEGTKQSFKTLPDPPSLTIPAASEITQISAKVSGSVNPNGDTVSDCHVDYGTTTSYGSQKPCVPPPGSGSGPVPVSVSLTGLTPGVLYHYRVVATNPGGTTNGADQSLVTLAPNPPAVLNDGANPGAADTFTMEGRVDPNGLAVSDCHFAYGPTGEYGNTAPCTPSAVSLGVGDAPIVVTAATEALEPNTTYHFRLYAANLRGSAQGKDRVFTTGSGPADSCANADIRAAQGIEVSRLPDCMALEQVSPSNKGNQSARQPAALTADGGRILFSSIATLGNCTNVNGIGGDFFIASQGEGSTWGIECANPQIGNGIGSGGPQFSFTPDLSRWLQFISSDNGPSFVQEGLGGHLRFLSPGLVNSNGFGNPGFVGASADHSRLYFEAEAGGTFLPGDPETSGPGSATNLYLSHPNPGGSPSAVLSAKDQAGKIWGGSCGAVLGGGNFSSQGSISADGQRAYFSTRPTQPASGPCTEANKKRIMVREEAPGGPTIEELIANECARVSPDPACSSADGDDLYRAASLDQSKVYFNSSRQLASSDLDATSDLYLYDASRSSGQRLTQVSAGEVTPSHATAGSGAVVSTVNAVSRDGSHAYFTSSAVLTTALNPEGKEAQNGQENLYLYEAGSGDLLFVGTLGTASVERPYPVPVTGKDSGGHEVGGDGHIFLFLTRGKLTSDDTDSASDVYRYDADADTLDRVSVAGPGGDDQGPSDAAAMFSTDRGSSTDYAVQGRWVSEDGETVVYTTDAALLPSDTNGVEDSYMWQEGHVYHLPGSARASSGAKRILPIVSQDGTTIAYHSTKRLLPSDGDSVEDVYVLRAGGGVRTPVRPICEGEACQGAPPTVSGEVGATTSSFAGAGNAKPKQSNARKCPQGKRKVRRKGKARCVKPAKHEKHAKKRTSAKQGGQK